MGAELEQAKLAEKARARAEYRQLKLENGTTAYWFYPAKNKASGSVILIHGYRGNHHGLEAIAGAIENLDVYIPDIPGFGQSDSFTSQHSIDNYAGWVHEFIIGLKFKHRPHLLGHSFGSIVVSNYASQFDDIESLILENPVSAPALKGPKAMMTQLAKAFFWLAGILPEKTGDAILQSWPMVRGMSIVMTKSRVAELRNWIHQQHDQNFNDYRSRKVALEGYSASISNCVADYSRSFKVPVLMLIGQKDDITSVPQQRKLFESLTVAKKEFKVFNGVGHLTHYEIPREIANAIEKWCTNA